MNDLKKAIEILSIIESEINDEDGVLYEFKEIVSDWDSNEWFDWIEDIISPNFKFTKTQIFKASKMIGEF